MFPSSFQIKPPHDANIQSSILSNLPPSAGASTFDEDYVASFTPDTLPSLIDPWQDTTDAYLAALKASLVINEDGPQVDFVYTAMHGVGADYIDMAFEQCGFKAVNHVKEQRGQ